MQNHKSELCRIAALLFQRGLVSGADGNLSLRLSEDTMLITPSGICKGMLEPEMLIVQKLTGEVISGTYKSTKEAIMHGKIYQSRPDISAIVHTHPAAATAFAVCGNVLPNNSLVEVGAVIGEMRLVEYEKAGSLALAEAVERQVKEADILFLQNHGIITCADDLKKAFVKMDAVENAAKTLVMAKVLGEIKTFRV